MSEANYYQPHVWINGRRLAESGPVDSETAIADFKIKWGSDNWWDNVDPSELQLRILDPYGEVLEQLEGSEVRITRDPDGTTVWRGTIDAVRSKLGVTNDPRTGKNRQMWTHEIRAYDPLGTAQRDRRRGPIYTNADHVPYRMHWGPCYMNERKADIDLRTPAAIEWQESPIDWLDGQFMMILPVSAYEQQQVVSLLTVIRQTARIIDPTARPFYDPATDTIKLIQAGYAGAATGLEYILGSPIIFLAPQTPHDVLDGTQWSMAGDLEISTDARDLVTRVEVAMRTTTGKKDADNKNYLENIDYTRAVELTTAGTSQMTVQIESDVTYGHLIADEDLWTGYANTLRGALNRSYGYPRLPALTHRFRKHTSSPSYERYLNPAPQMNDYANPTAFQLINSYTNILPTAPRFCIVGGELSYSHRRGWAATIFPAGIGQGILRPTLGNVTETRQIRFGHPDNLIADWQHLARAH